MAYQQQYEKLVTAMLTGETLEPGTPPEDLGDSQLSLIPGVLCGLRAINSRFISPILEGVQLKVAHNLL